jgi:HEAT repeat protein
VRREVIRALGLVGGPKAGEILLQAIEDEDPQIRMAALRYLPGAQSFAVMDSLMEIITRTDFAERALSEKRVFFEIMAEIGQERVLPFLIKQLKNRGLFFMGSAKNEELRIGAAYGLGNIHNREALEALKSEGPKSKKGSLLADAISYSLNKLTAPAQSSGRVDSDV